MTELLDHARTCLLWAVAAGLVAMPFLLLLTPALCGMTARHDRNHP